MNTSACSDCTEQGLLEPSDGTRPHIPREARNMRRFIRTLEIRMKRTLMATALVCLIGCATSPQLSVYPQDTPEATLRSVAKALANEEYEYFVDHLYDPQNRQAEVDRPDFDRQEWLDHIRKVSQKFGPEFYRECLKGNKREVEGHYVFISPSGDKEVHVRRHGNRYYPFFWKVKE
jgi:hypothetical protein